MSRASASRRGAIACAYLVGLATCQAPRETPVQREAREREERQALAKQSQEVRAAVRRAAMVVQAKIDAQCPPLYATWRKLPNPAPQGEEETALIAHVKQSIENASAEKSKLSQDALKVEGMSSAKTRHLLNNLGSRPDTSYLEVGLWKGSTFVSTLFANSETVRQAIGIDNWSQFNGKEARPAFMANVAKLLPKQEPRVLEGDCFAVDKTQFGKHVNLYLYDGDHTMEAQKEGMTYFADVLASPAVILVDDWNECQERQGTYEGLTEKGLSVIYEANLLKVDGFSSGFYVSVVRKSPGSARAR